MISRIAVPAFVALRLTFVISMEENVLIPVQVPVPSVKSSDLTQYVASTPQSGSLENIPAA